MPKNCWMSGMYCKPDRTQHSVVSDLGWHCLLRPVCVPVLQVNIVNKTRLPVRCFFVIQCLASNPRSCHNFENRVHIAPDKLLLSSKNCHYFFFSMKTYGKCPKISSTLFHTFHTLFLKILSRMANSVDPDQEQSYLGLHCLHKPFCMELWCSIF